MDVIFAVAGADGDSMYAVDPVAVRENAEKLTVAEIVERCQQLSEAQGMYVTLSGGNPALMPFRRGEDLPRTLQASGYRVSVETQGTVWRDWLLDVDHLTISPKPPSSGMWNEKNRRQMVAFLETAAWMPEGRTSIKIVVFDQTDLDWARTVMQDYSDWNLRFLSVGTDQDNLQDEWKLLGGIAERYRWLCEAIAGDPAFTNVKVLPQCHVIAFGAKRGV